MIRETPNIDFFLICIHILNVHIFINIFRNLEVGLANRRGDMSVFVRKYPNVPKL